MEVTLEISPIFKIPEFTISIDSYRDIVSALINLFPDKKLAAEKIILLDGERIVTKELLDFVPKTNQIKVLPMISGGLPSSFDSLGNLTQFYGTNTILSSEEIAVSGLSKRILDSSLFGKVQTAFDISMRAANRERNVKEDTNDPTTGFGSLTLSSIKGQAIPLHFGLVRVSGSVINQYVKHIQRGGIDTVNVDDYVT